MITLTDAVIRHFLKDQREPEIIVRFSEESLTNVPRSNGMIDPWGKTGYLVPISQEQGFIVVINASQLVATAQPVLQPTEWNHYLRAVSLRQHLFLMMSADDVPEEQTIPAVDAWMETSAMNHWSLINRVEVFG